MAIKSKFSRKLSDLEKRQVQKRDLAPDTIRKTEERIKELQAQIDKMKGSLNKGGK